MSNRSSSSFPVTGLTRTQSPTAQILTSAKPAGDRASARSQTNIFMSAPGLISDTAVGVGDGDVSIGNRRTAGIGHGPNNAAEHRLAQRWAHQQSGNCCEKNKPTQSAPHAPL